MCIRDSAEPAQEPQQHKAVFEAALDFLGSAEIPMVVACGNQDGDGLFDEVVGPRLEAFLGQAVERPYFSFEADHTLFIVLYTSFWDDTQCQWLEAVLRERSEDSNHRTFVFGHHPIWTVARAFFSERDFQSDILALLDRYSIDAYFCGHSHLSLIHI